MGLSSVMSRLFYFFVLFGFTQLGTLRWFCDLNSIVLVYMLGFVARRLRIA